LRQNGGPGLRMRMRQHAGSGRSSQDVSLTGVGLESARSGVGTQLRSPHKDFWGGWDARREGSRVGGKKPRVIVSKMKSNADPEAK